jgi:glutathione S-transferase
MQLYHLPGSRSSRVLWALEETGAEYKLVPVTADERKGAEHLARHPLGRVPVAEIDGRLVFETAALCLHLAESHAEAGLLPAVGTVDRALVYQWISFGLTEIEPATAEVFRFRENDAARADAGRERFAAAAAVIDNTLAEHEYLVGDLFTIADLVCGSTLFGGQRVGLALGENTEQYLDRLAARPARQRAYPPT